MSEWEPYNGEYNDGIDRSVYDLVKLTRYLKMSTGWDLKKSYEITKLVCLLDQAEHKARIMLSDVEDLKYKIENMRNAFDPMREALEAAESYSDNDEGTEARELRRKIRAVLALAEKE